MYNASTVQTGEGKVVLESREHRLLIGVGGEGGGSDSLYQTTHRLRRIALLWPSTLSQARRAVGRSAGRQGMA